MYRSTVHVSALSVVATIKALYKYSSFLFLFLQAVSHPPGGRLPLLSARPAVTSPAAEHHRPLAGTKLYCLVTEAHRCKQLA